MELRIPSTYDDGKIPAQGAFRRSPAKVRGYGGAMGGGKSFAICQEAFDMALDYPGILLPMFRQKHTAITNTTRRTFIEQVLPAELRGRDDLVRIKQSGGEDFVEFKWNGSQVHFVGLDDPGKWFSSEIGAAMFDEAHEMDEKDVVTIISRLRQRCKACVDAGDATCAHMPRGICMAFNPSYPGHWLQEWCILGAQRTEYGYRKDELLPTDAESSIGDLEFFLARATDNPFLPPGYVEQSLGGMGKMQRRRFLEGLWEHIGGDGFFDQEALTRLAEQSMEMRPLLIGEPDGDAAGQDREKLPSIRPRGNGRMEVFKAPVRFHVLEDGTEVLAHRYTVGIDSSSGAGADYSAVQVFDAEKWEQVAEWQGKVDPDQLARVAFLTGCVYNGALLIPEITGGWGFAVTKKLQKLIGGWQGSQRAKPKLYTRPVVDKISDQWTDQLGWDTNRKSRAQMLSTLEEALRDGSLEVYGSKTIAELGAFAFPEYSGTGDYGVPQARKHKHDDLVIALAICVHVGERLPKVVKDPRPMVMRTS